MEIPAEALAAAGGAVAAVVGALWWQVRDRVKKLESAVAAGLQREAASAEARIASANGFAEAMRQMTERTTRAMDRYAAVVDRNQEVLARLLDHLATRPCLADPHDPRPQTFHQQPVSAVEPRSRVPSSVDLPAVDPPTDRHSPQDARWRTAR